MKISAFCVQDRVSWSCASAAAEKLQAHYHLHGSQMLKTPLLVMPLRGPSSCLRLGHAAYPLIHEKAGSKLFSLLCAAQSPGLADLPTIRSFSLLSSQVRGPNTANPMQSGETGPLPVLFLSAAAEPVLCSLGSESALRVWLTSAAQQCRPASCAHYRPGISGHQH